ncbi:MAG: tol-pal system protein YbgF [Beijerinckiaceae bacterium]
MFQFGKPLLSRAAANLAAKLFVALVAIAAGAETTYAQEAAIVRPGAQIAAAGSRIHVAQGYGRPPGEIGAPPGSPYDGEPEAATSQDAAALLVRIGRLESQMRQISGQIEQMQFETGRLAEQLKKFEEDVEFRMRDGGAQGAPVAKPPQKRSEAPETQFNADGGGHPQITAPAAPRANRHGDAFDPSQHPGAVGAPRPLGSLAPAASSNPAGGSSNESGPASFERNEPGAPLDLTNGRSRVEAPPPTTAAPRASAGVPSSVMATAGGTVIATATNSAKEEFDIALGYFKQRAYENAEKGFIGFLAKNPKNTLASDAIYYLGESFYQRGRQPEAAEQYLKISTQYANSPRAPDALLRLGQSLNALGAKDQACATYGEIARKYPNAPATVKAGAEREAKRAQC